MTESDQIKKLENNYNKLLDRVISLEQKLDTNILLEERIKKIEREGIPIISNPILFLSITFAISFILKLLDLTLPIMGNWLIQFF